MKDVAARHGHHRTALRLLWSGAAAGPIYVSVGLFQILTRDGFDVRRHALSLLSNGEFGWVQICNFLLSGILVMAGALGSRSALGNGRGRTWAPILLAVYGLGLVGAGLFTADPAPDFPPGASSPTHGMSRHGLLHFLCGGLGFYSLIGACFILSWRFAGLRRRGWTIYSAATGFGFLFAFAGIASGSSSTVVMLAFYLAVLWVWIWHSAISLTLARELSTDSRGPAR